jgi:hypothetical protein
MKEAPYLVGHPATELFYFILFYLFILIQKFGIKNIIVLNFLLYNLYAEIFKNNSAIVVTDHCTYS